MTGRVYIAELGTVVDKGRGMAARAKLALAGVPQALLAVIEVTNQQSGEVADGLYCLKGIACCNEEATEFAQGYSQSNPGAVLMALADWPHAIDGAPQERFRTRLGEFVVFPSVDWPEVA